MIATNLREVNSSYPPQQSIYTNMWWVISRKMRQIWQVSLIMTKNKILEVWLSWYFHLYDELIFSMDAFSVLVKLIIL